MKKIFSPLVSVIVTTYNRKELLKETIYSILDQTYQNFELIVVDNNSNYDFPKYMKSFNDDRIKAYQNQNNGVISVNRNFGIKKSNGEFIAFCDDDDVWLKNKLKKQIDFMFKNDFWGVSSSRILFGDIKSEIIPKIKDKIFDKKNIFYERGIILSSLLIRKSELYFNESKEVVFVADYEFLVRHIFEKNLKVFMQKDPLVKYRINSNYSSNIQNVKQQLNVIKLHEENFSNRIRKKAYALAYFNISLTSFGLGEIYLARTYVIKSLFFSKINQYPKIIFFVILYYMPKTLSRFIVNKLLPIINFNIIVN